MKKNNLPLVSILTPVKNEELHIYEAISSVLSQSYSNIELIIVDDGSVDNTNDQISKFSDDRLVHIKGKGLGKNNAFNTAFQHSKGDLILYFAGDDIMPLNSIEIRVNSFVNHVQEKSALFGRLITFSKVKKFDGNIMPKSKSKGNTSGGTTMFTRKLAEELFPIPEFLANEDIWTSLYIKYFANKIIHINDILLKYRIHENNSFSFLSSFSTKNSQIHKRHIAYAVFLERYREQLTVDEKSELLALSSLEFLRFNGDILAILLMSGITFSQRISAVFNSNNVLYKIKNILYSFLSGR